MWEVKSLAELEEVGVLKLGRGKIISKKDLAASPGDFPVYSSSKVGDGKFGEYGLFMFDEELITWSIDGGGRLFHRKKHKFSITNVTGFLRILDASVFSYKYLYYALSLLHSKINFDWVKKAHPSVLRKEYKHIPVPPLAEQERIVAKLDVAFAEIDEAIELGQERLSRAAKALGQIVDNELSELREEHESCSLGEMLESVEYGTSTKCSKTGKYPVLRMGNMQTGSFVMDDLVYLDSDKELEKYRVRKGDVFFNRTNSALHVGKAAIYDGGSDCLFAGYLIRLNYSDDVLDGRFLNYYLNAPSTRAYGYSVMTSSVNQSNINGTKLKEYPFIKVDLKTQHCIRKKLDDITALLYQVHFLLGKSLSEYAQLKSAILAQELQSSEAA